MRRFLIVAVLPLMLGGCGLPPAFTAIAYLLDGASLFGTGKTVGDHALSAVAQEDCAIWRVAKGELICQGPTEKGKPSAFALAARVSDYPGEPAPEPAVQTAAEPAPQPVDTRIAAPASGPGIVQLADISPQAGSSGATAGKADVQAAAGNDWQPVLTLGNARRATAWPIAAARTAPIGSDISSIMAAAPHAPAIDAAMLRAQQRLLRFRGDGLLARRPCAATAAGCSVQQAALPNG